MHTESVHDFCSVGRCMHIYLQVQAAMHMHLTMVVIKNLHTCNWSAMLRKMVQVLGSLVFNFVTAQ